MSNDNKPCVELLNFNFFNMRQGTPHTRIEVQISRSGLRRVFFSSFIIIIFLGYQFFGLNAIAVWF